MKSKFWIVYALLTLATFAQPAKPTLSTSDRVALNSLEAKKAEAQKMFNDAKQQELSILREWQQAHPGWKINPDTFVIEEDKPEPKK